MQNLSRRGLPELAAQSARQGLPELAAKPFNKLHFCVQYQGHLTIQEGAAETIRLALLPDDGPTGGYFETAGPNPW